MCFTQILRNILRILLSLTSLWVKLLWHTSMFHIHHVAFFAKNEVIIASINNRLSALPSNRTYYLWLPFAWYRRSSVHKEGYCLDAIKGTFISYTKGYAFGCETSISRWIQLHYSRLIWFFIDWSRIKISRHDFRLSFTALPEKNQISLENFCPRTQI